MSAPDIEVTEHTAWMARARFMSEWCTLAGYGSRARLALTVIYA